MYKKKNLVLNGKKRLLINFSFLLILSVILIISCQIQNLPFNKNAKVKGYIINTTQELLHKGTIVGQSPPIEYYFVPQKYVSHSDRIFKLNSTPRIYELNICEREVKKILRQEADTILYDVSSKGIVNYSYITKGVFLIKKSIDIKNEKKHYKLKGYQISINNKDTISVLMNHHFKYVGLLRID